MTSVTTNKEVGKGDVNFFEKEREKLVEEISTVSPVQSHLKFNPIITVTPKYYTLCVVNLHTGML